VFVLIFIGLLLFRVFGTVEIGSLPFGGELSALATPDCAAGLRVRLDLHCVPLSLRFLELWIWLRLKPPARRRLAASWGLATPNGAACFGVRLDFHVVDLGG